jgi:hypothetical protein
MLTWYQSKTQNKNPKLLPQLGLGKSPTAAPLFFISDPTPARFSLSHRSNQRLGLEVSAS